MPATEPLPLPLPGSGLIAGVILLVSPPEANSETE